MQNENETTTKLPGAYAAAQDVNDLIVQLEKDRDYYRERYLEKINRESELKSVIKGLSELLAELAR